MTIFEFLRAEYRAVNDKAKASSDRYYEGYAAALRDLMDIARAKDNVLTQSERIVEAANKELDGFELTTRTVVLSDDMRDAVTMVVAHVRRAMKEIL